MPAIGAVGSYVSVLWGTSNLTNVHADIDYVTFQLVLLNIYFLFSFSGNISLLVSLETAFYGIYANGMLLGLWGL